MNFLLDILLLLIVVQTVVRCTMRGFVKSIIHLVSLVAAFIAARTFSSPVSAWLRENVFSDRITASLRETISSLAERSRDVFDLSRLFADMPEEFSALLARYGADTEQLAATYGSFAEANTETAAKLADSIAEPVVSGLANVCGFILVFLAALIACTLIGALIDLIFKLPILRTANRFLGFLLGLICAAAFTLIYVGAAEHLMAYLHSVYPATFSADIVDRTLLVKYICQLGIFG